MAELLPCVEITPPGEVSSSIVWLHGLGANGHDFEPVVPYLRLPRTRFVLGHAGALQMEEALALACRYPNVWLELSGQSLANVRTILERADPDRILYGSDWPFYHQAIGMAKVLIATEGRADLRAKVLYRNAAAILGM